jgi:two-component system chemotaxis response regulator CheB
MKFIKVLVIDNDVFVRRIFYNILDTYKSVETKVICDFENLLPIVEAENFDIAFVNVEENGDSGKMIFDILTNRNPNILLVALAQRTEWGSESIIKALNKGAVDFITIPLKQTSVLMAHDHFKKRIDHILKNMAQNNTDFKISELPILRNQKSRPKQAKIVILGCGSEGIKTIYTLLSKLPASLAAPMIVVSHFPKILTKKLAEFLNTESELNIEEAFDGAELVPGRVWIIPGGQHGEVVQGNSGYCIRLHKGPRENEERPSLDVAFRSIARQAGSGALGLLLGGYGHDGVPGARSLKNHGGDIIILNPEGFFASKLLVDIAEAGLVDQICTVNNISLEIIKRARLIKRKIKKETAHKYDIM